MKVIFWSNKNEKLRKGIKYTKHLKYTFPDRALTLYIRN